MAWELTIDTSELTEFAERLEGLSPAFLRAMDDLMRRTVSALEQGVTGRTPVNSGALRASWGTKVTAGSTAVVGELFTPLAYAPVVEMGRTPGKRPPPTGAIQLWVERKGIASGGEAEAIAYVIARAIGRRGIPPKKMLERTLDALWPTIETWWRQLPARVIERFGDGTG